MKTYTETQVKLKIALAVRRALGIQAMRMLMMAIPDEQFTKTFVFKELLAQAHASDASSFE